MKNKYKVSVIIPTYNRSKLLELSLLSLCNQNVSTDLYEVIIVDDGSTDNTKEIVHNFTNKLNIKYFFQEKDGYRVSVARNTGIKNSEGTICVLLDCGVIVASDAIEKNIECHSDTNVEKAAIGYLYGFDEYNENEQYLLDLHIDASNVDQYFDKLEKDKIYDLREHVYQEIGDDMTKWPAPWTIFWTGYASIKKETLIRVGMFNEYFKTWGCEDTDLGLSLYTNNVQIVLDRNLKSIHYPHEKSRAIVGEDSLREKRIYLHKKYNLKNTELFIDIPSRQLNQYILNQQNQKGDES